MDTNGRQAQKMERKPVDLGKKNVKKAFGEPLEDNAKNGNALRIGASTMGHAVAVTSRSGEGSVFVSGTTEGEITMGARSEGEATFKKFRDG